MFVKTTIGEILSIDEIIINEIETTQNKSDETYFNEILIIHFHEYNKNNLNIKMFFNIKAYFVI